MQIEPVGYREKYLSARSLVIGGGLGIAVREPWWLRVGVFTILAGRWFYLSRKVKARDGC